METMEIKITDYFKVQPTKLYMNDRPKMYPAAPPKTGDPLTQEYHSELTESLKAFQNKPWKPLPVQKQAVPVIITCPAPKKAKRQIIMSRNRLVVPAWEPPSRPRSVLSDNARPMSSSSRPETPHVQPGNFDTLDSETLARLIGLERPTSVYGERCDLSEYLDKIPNDDDDSSIGSDWSLLEDWEEPEVHQYQACSMADFNMRPEQLDLIDIPVDRKERKLYDFDANNRDVPHPHDYKDILPKGARYLDFSVVAKQGLEWRNLTEMPQSQTIVRMYDRLVHLEKLQNETIQREEKKNRPVSRRQTLVRSLSAKSRDKQCCSSCLQVACVGDCPEKSYAKCSMCNKVLCPGLCSTSYDTHMRSNVTTDDLPSQQNSPPKTRICLSCTKKNTAKLINANNKLLGRPKSSNATFSRGRNSVKPKDIRPKSAVDYTTETFQQFDNLGLDSPSRPSTAVSVSSRPRSRNGLLPGKTFSSNRKASISDAKYKSACRVRNRSPRPRLNISQSIS
ncbi:hypothetical protein LOTGIDRAFT_169688 [Lottia gigantea]|uniref:Uncharacterized protein n=1 Tax=Lottia gigantea TaxID=225164 RepID=V3ZFZ3_LOTGI|nr:hypothetical protein LOTGIDRAFT_169688 [Lottia gigantea]ESO83052.1 hypothetical protein LOTGIDRAFT_169688 [Lottia gigantea]